MEDVISKVDWTGVSGVIGALGVIILGILIPILTSRINRKDKEFERALDRKDKELDAKLKQRDEKAKLETDKYRRKLNYAYSLVYGYLWHLIYKIDADRISIIQPHPLEDRQYISISFEVINPVRDIASHKNNFQFYKMPEWGGMIARWMDNKFIVYKNISEIKDIKLHPEAFRRGVKSVVFVRMTNVNEYWIGTMAIDYTHTMPANIDMIKNEASNICILIADVLPEYNPINMDRI